MSTATNNLGQLVSANARHVWPSESTDFTPWLAQPENLGRLANAIGIELEPENTEVAVGPYSADIVAREVGADRYVVIENQLEKTDHDHLGKAITYAASLGAGTVVWVATAFTDEHRKALDWLNDNSVDDIAFFGVQLEVWRIDNSNPAVRFNVVVRPVGLVKQLANQKAAAAASPTRQLQLEWWTTVAEALVETKKLPSVQTAAARYWFDVAIGRSGFYLSCIASPDTGRIGVRLYMSGRSGGRQALEQLLLQKAAIEGELGEPLQWNTNPTATDKVILVDYPAKLEDKTRWPEYLAWMTTHIFAMRDVFAPRVKKLQLQAESAGEA